MKKTEKHLGFLTFPRELPKEESPEQRISHYKEFYQDFPKKKTLEQASRCMDCGVPFCHSACPLGNHIPAFNEAVYEEDWKAAYEILDETNNFPEFTGRVCPAPCEQSCVLGINQPAVSIEHIEKTIIEEAYRHGWVHAKLPKRRTGKSVAIIGSGPAGLAAAEQLNLQGHEVHVYEKDLHAGGLLRYGIPDFKLEKWVIDRRLSFMEKAGIRFHLGVEVGKDVSIEEIKAQSDAIVLCTGAPVAREVNIPGRHLQGVQLAMDYLSEQNKLVSGEIQQGSISAKDKKVLVIGGGDTGSDCIGTAHRQGATNVQQITWGNQPPTSRNLDNPWPEWPMILHTSSSQAEGVDRKWNILTKEFIGNEQGELTGLKVVQVEWEKGRKSFQEVAGSEQLVPCELALISIGFTSQAPLNLLEKLGVKSGEKGEVLEKEYAANEGVFVAGDLRRGASLLVWAIQEGREAAEACDTFLNS